MIEKKCKISYNNRGSAIITAMVVTTVLMVLCLSLLSVAYSLFLSQKGNTSDMPERELLYSAVETFEGELLNTGAVSSSSGGTTGGSGENTGVSEFGESILDTVLLELDNIVKTESGYKLKDGVSSKWLCYDLMAGSSSNPGEASDLEKCSRFFNITSIGSVKIVAQMYWTLPLDWDGTKEKAAGTTLHAIYRLYNAKTMELKVKAEREYKLAGWMNKGSGDPEIPISITGNYSIHFFNCIGSTSKEYLPKALYFNSLDEITFPVLEEYTDYSFHKTSTADSATLIDTREKLLDLFTGEEKHINLFINWGGDGAPYAVRFILNGKCIAVKKWRKNKPTENDWNKTTMEELVSNNKAYYGIDSSDCIGDWIYTDWENNGNPTQVDGDVNVFIVLKSNYIDGKFNEGDDNPTYNIKFDTIPEFTGESLDITVDKGTFHWERVFDSLNENTEPEQGN